MAFFGNNRKSFSMPTMILVIVNLVSPSISRLIFNGYKNARKSVCEVGGRVHAKVVCCLEKVDDCTQRYRSYFYLAFLNKTPCKVSCCSYSRFLIWFHCL